MFPYTGERAVPWNKATGQGVMVPHIARYAWACQFAWQKSVVDLACGTGYGSFMLSWVAKQVTGIDRDLESITFAESRFEADNLSFEQGDITGRLPGADIYVAFECLEHLPALDCIKARPLVWSVPVNVGSQWHTRPYIFKEILKKMVGSEFYYQLDDWLILPDAVAWDYDYHTTAGDGVKYVLGVLR